MKTVYDLEKSYTTKQIQANNKAKIVIANKYAKQMRCNPSYLEKIMKEILDWKKVKYVQQKIFYIKDKSGFITHFYIADFYIPKKKTIIELDGKQHKDNKEYDRIRTYEIQRQYKGVKVIRYTYKDIIQNNPV